MITSPLTVLVARVVTAPILLVALATLVRGYKGVGDGFAGGLIAALAVLLQYPAFGPEGARRLLPVHLAPHFALAGLFAALLLAAAPLLWGEPPLTHTPGGEPAHVGSIDVATAFAYDAAIFVLVLGVVVAIFDALVHAASEGEHDDDEAAAE